MHVLAMFNSKNNNYVEICKKPRKAYGTYVHLAGLYQEINSKILNLLPLANSTHFLGRRRQRRDYREHHSTKKEIL